MQINDLRIKRRTHNVYVHDISVCICVYEGEKCNPICRYACLKDTNLRSDYNLSPTEI